MSILTQQRVLLVLAILVIPVLAVAAWWLTVRFTGPSVVSNAYVGKSEADLTWAYGAPVSDLAGYRALGMSVPPTLPKTPIRTLRFRPGLLFHPRGGTLWVWLTRQNGKWVCFESCWFADGVQF
jgi:hypothetical protein